MTNLPKSLKKTKIAAALAAVLAFYSSAPAFGVTADESLGLANMTRVNTQRIAVQQAIIALAAESSDVDGDGYTEAPAMVAGAGAPVGGGFIPGTSAAPKNDSYGTKLGYCSFDNGSVNASTGRLTGAVNGYSAPVLAVIAAGADNVFQTTCANIAAGLGGQGDDYVVAYNSTQIQMGNSGTLFYGDPVADVAALNALAQATLKDGQVRVVKSTNSLYRWNASTLTWNQIASSSPISALTAATAANAINNGNYSQNWNWNLSGNGTALVIGENVASTGGTGTQYLQTIGTLAGSTAVPLSVSTRGVETFRVDSIKPQIVANAGTLAAPTYSFAGAQSTGFYMPDDKRVGLAISGINQLKIGRNYIGIGENALANETYGSSTQNVAIGNNALTLARGNENVGVGYLALYKSDTGVRNTALGSKALGSLGYFGSDTSAFNTGTGANAGLNAFGGTYNTFLGAGSDTSNGATLSYMTAVGGMAQVYTANTVVLGRASTYAGGMPTGDRTVIGGNSDSGSSAVLQINGASQHIPMAAPPVGAAGVMYYDNALGQYMYHNGITWAPVSGTRAISGLTNATNNNSLNNSAYAQSWNWSLTGNTTALAIAENVASTGGTGTQYLQTIGTLAGSTAIPLSVSTRGVEAFRIDSTNPQILGNGGSVSAPTYSFAGQANVGLYLAAPGQLGASVGGLRSMWLANSATALGYGAMLSDPNTSSVGIGYMALNQNTANQNVAVGYLASANSTTANLNVAVGFRALATNTTGGSNTAVGSNAMYFSTTGQYNAAFGSASLFQNTTGTRNTAAGVSALASNTTGTNNTAVGQAANNMNSTGSFNVAIGDSAGSVNSGIANSANYITLLGASTFASPVAGSGDAYMTAIGAGSQVNSFNTVVLGRATDKTVIGATTDNGSGNTLQVTGGIQAITGNITNTAGQFVGGLGSVAAPTYAFNGNLGTGLYMPAAGQLAGSLNGTRTLWLTGGSLGIGSGALAVDTSGVSTAMGYHALNKNTTGANTAVGYLALAANTTGAYNIAVGDTALQANTVGTNNSAFGSGALAANTVSSSNSAFGYSALTSVSTGNQNTAFGNQAFSSLTTGGSNTSVGSFALASVVSGSSNSGFGAAAGFSNNANANNSSYITLIGVATSATPGASSSVAYMTALGAGANVSTINTVVLGRTTDKTVIGATGDNGSGNSLQVTGGIQAVTGNITNTAGQFVAGLGTVAAPSYSFTGNLGTGLYTPGAGKLSASVSGTRSMFLSSNGVTGLGFGALAVDASAGATAVGFQALNKNTANINTAFGYQALANNDAGYYNVAVGDGVMLPNTTGYFNTAMGSTALGSNISGYQNTAYGLNALFNNTTGINNAATGTFALNNSTTGWQNTASGAYALFMNTTGTGNSGFGYNAGFTNNANSNSSSYITLIGANTSAASPAGVSAAYMTALGAGSSVTTFNTVVLGRTTDKTVIGATGNNGSGNALQVTGGSQVITGNTINSAGQFLSGVSGAPGYSFVGDTSTGMGRPAAGELAFTANGTVSGWISDNHLSFGKGALLATTTGTDNTVVGNNAMVLTDTGSNNSAFGTATLNFNKSGSGNTALGKFALLNNLADNNTATGMGSLYNTTTGYGNVGNGYSALTWNTTGSNNTGVGYLAGQSNNANANTGSYITLIGGSSSATPGSSGDLYMTAVGAGSNVSTVNTVVLGRATDKTVIGATGVNGSGNALQVTGGIQAVTGNITNTAGQFLGALGTAASPAYSFVGTTGTGFYAPSIKSVGIAMAGGPVLILQETAAWDLNFGVGYNALGSLTSGTNNVALGNNALYRTTSGVDNFAVGSSALYGNTTGSYNTAIGNAALMWNTIGTNNIAMGYGSLQNNTTGGSNVAMGFGALQYNTTGSANFTIRGLLNNTTGSNNTGIGSNTLNNLVSGTYNDAIGYAAGANVVSGSNNVFLGANSAVANTTLPGISNITLVGAGSNAVPTGAMANTTYMTALGSGSSVTTVNTVVLGRTTDKTVIGATGDNGSGNALQVTGGSQVITGNTINSAGQFRGQNGLPATPTYSFVSSTNTGLYSTGATNLSASVAGSQLLKIDAVPASTALNFGLGYFSLRNLTTGKNNFMLGSFSGYYTTTGQDNFGAGDGALNGNTTGNFNVAIGNGTLFNNDNGSSNVAIGVTALNANTSGTNNNAIGANGLAKNTTGSNNNAFGASLGNNTVGLRNNAHGDSSLGDAVSGNFNTAMGDSSGRNVVSGQYNVFVGASASVANTTLPGISNITLLGANTSAIPTGAMANNAYMTAIGSGAAVSTVNTVVLGRTTDKTVIGATGDNGSGNALQVTGGSQVITGNTINSAGQFLGANGSATAPTYSFASNTNTGLYAPSATQLALSIGGANQLVVDKVLNNFSAIGALSGTTTGTDNIAIGAGFGVMLSNTTGSSNLALGRSALNSNTTGYGNIALGESSLFSNTTSSYNVALGIGAQLYSVGNNNIGLGQEALRDNTGYSNIGLGYKTLDFNSGSYNIAIGPQSLTSNSGAENIALGNNAVLANGSAQYNVGIGSSALTNSASGGLNVGVGYLAGYGLTARTGMNSVFLGANTTNADTAPMAGSGYVTLLGANSTASGLLAANANAYMTAVGAGSNVTTINSVVLGRTTDKTVIGATGDSGSTALLQINGASQHRGIATASAPAGSAGMMYYDSTLSRFQYNDGVSWKDMYAGAATAPAGPVALSSITAATSANTIANGAFAQAWNWQMSSNTTGFAIGENTASSGGTGTQYLMSIGTLAGSTASPLMVSTGGVETFRISASAPQILANSGTVAAPTYSFSASAGSGMYLPSATQIALAVGGTQQLLVDKANASFAVNAANATGTNSVVIGGAVAAAMAGSGNVTLVGSGSSTTTLAAPNANAYMTAIGAGASVGTVNTVVLGRSTDKIVLGASADDLSGYRLQVTGGLEVKTGNSANLAGQFIGASGTAAAPTFSFTGNLGSGLYLPSATQISLAIGGTQQLLVDKANANFAVNATNANGANNIVLGGTVVASMAGSGNVTLLGAGANTAVLGAPNANAYMTAIGAGATVSTINTVALGRTSDRIVIGASADNLAGRKLQVTGGIEAVTGQYVGTNGTVAAPTYTFTGNTGSGLYIPSANKIGLSIAGASALSLDNTNGNIGAGLSALSALTTGTQNIGIGEQALSIETTGSANIAIGFQALGAGSGTLSDNVAVGYDAMAFANGGMRNVAIGRDALQVTAGANYMVAVGYGAGVVPGSANPLSGSGSTFIGANAASADNTIMADSGYITLIGAGSSATGLLGANPTAYMTAIGAGSTVSTINTVVLGRATDNVVIGQSGKGAYKFTVNGTAGGTSAYAVSSDRRFKQHITELSNALDTIKQLQGVSYEFNQAAFPGRQFEKGRQLGFIAQQIEPFVPEVVRTDEQGYKSVQYSQLVPLLVEGMKEQQNVLQYLSKKDDVTLSVNIATLEGNAAHFQRVETEALLAKDLEAETARIKQLKVQELQANKIEAKNIRTDVVKTGETEAYIQSGSFQPMFTPSAGTQYIVNATADDGSTAFASVAMSGGHIVVTPISGNGIEVVVLGTQVGVAAQNKKVKATWIRMS